MHLGDRIKERRLALGWSLARLAREAHAATSYVWLLEQGRIAEPRPARLQALASALGCSPSDLTSVVPERRKRKATLLRAIQQGSVWGSLGLPEWTAPDVDDLSDRAIDALHALHGLRQEQEGAEPSPREPQWLAQHRDVIGNLSGHPHRPDLEELAVSLRRSRLPRRSETELIEAPLSVTELRGLARKQGLTVEISRRLPSQFISHLDDDAPKPTLYLSERLAPAHSVFNLARGIALFVLRRQRTYEPLHRNPFAEKLAVDYLAGAILIPRPALVRDTAAVEYDVDALAKKWNSDWETIAIRCAQLPPEEGVAFHFLKLDPAGNLVGFLPGSGLTLQAAAGACPKWGAVRAFLLAPLSVHRQYSLFPSGERYFCFSRVVCYDRSDPLAVNPYGRRDSQQFFYSITLGCAARRENLERIKYAKEYVHTDDAEIPIGPGCAGCEWEDCSQRVRPHIAWTRFTLSLTSRKWSRYSRLTPEDQRDLRQAVPAPRRKGG